MQIREVVLYSHHGKNWPIPFKIGKLNIIKGIPSSGKTALTDIVEYCIGRERCMVADGPIRDLVKWYGILFQLQNTRIFVARKVPNIGDTKSKECYFKQGNELKSPEIIDESNISFDSLIEKLTELLGISPNLELPISTTYDLKQPITIKNAIYYCFQPQDEIISRGMLFHRQAEKWRDVMISKTLPYFLGAMPENYAQLNFKLIKERKEKFRLEQDLKEIKDIKFEGISKAQYLFSQARTLGLITNDKMIDNGQDYHKVFDEALKWKPAEVILPIDNELPQLQKDARQAQQRLDSIEESLREARDFDEELTGYGEELTHQKIRLESIGLFEPNTANSNKCPLCSNIIDQKNSQINSFENSIMQLESNLESVQREKPNIRKYLDDLYTEKEKLRQELKNKLTIIQSKYDIEQQLQYLHNLDMTRANLQGQIQFWLDSVKISDPQSELMKSLNEKLKLIHEIEMQIDDAQIKSKQKLILRNISSQITEWAKYLNLGYSEYAIVIDLNQLTLLFDKDGRLQPFQTIGGGQNWTSYHVLLHLALHKHFRQYKRPVPQFLFLDQPSSSHTAETTIQLYRLLVDVLHQLKSNFQIIITEPAEFCPSEFDEYVVDTWSDDKKLVPNDWIK